MADTNVLELAVKGTVEPKPSDMLEELGVGYTMPFSGTYDGLPNPNPVPIDDLQKMRRSDGHVRALIRLLTLPILASVADATYIPYEDGEEEAEFIEKCFTLPPSAGGMSVTLMRVMKAVTLAISEGFAAFEKVWQVPETGELAGKITLRKLAYRSSTTVRFKTDDKGGFNGLRQVTTVGGKTVDVWIKKEKAFYVAMQEEENPFYGVSYFLPAFYHYDKKVKLYYIAHMAAQFAAVSGRLGYMPGNPDLKERQAFKTALENFGFNTAMLVPEGYEVKPFQGGQSFDFLKLIQHHNHEMSKSVLAGFIDDENKPTLVDFSQGDSDMFVIAVNGIMDDISAAITHHVIPQLIDWNFGSGKYPTFKLGAIADSTKDIMKDAFNTLAAANKVNFTPEFVYELEKQVAERLNLEIDYDSLDAEFEERKALEQEAKKALLQAQKENPLGPPKPPPGGAAPPAGGKPAVKEAAAPPPPKPTALSAESNLDETYISVSDIAERTAEILLSQASAATQPRGKGGLWVESGGAAKGTPEARSHGVGKRELVGDERVSKAELKAARIKANEKILAAPKPTEADRLAHERRVAASKRQGGDDRGSSKDRRRSRENLVKEFSTDGGKTCPCVSCGRKLTSDTVSRSRIYPGNAGGSYKLTNLLPECYEDNQRLGSGQFKRFNMRGSASGAA